MMRLAAEGGEQPNEQHELPAIVVVQAGGTLTLVLAATRAAFHLEADDHRCAGMSKQRFTAELGVELAGEEAVPGAKHGQPPIAPKQFIEYNLR